MQLHKLHVSRPQVSLESAICVCVCVYYCSTYEKAVRVAGLVCVCVSFNYFALVLSLCCSRQVLLLNRCLRQSTRE